MFYSLLSCFVTLIFRQQVFFRKLEEGMIEYDFVYIAHKSTFMGRL